MSKLQIHIFNRQRDLPLSRRAIKATTRAILAFQNENCDEVSLHFVNRKTISALHAQFFDDPSPTDCISFPMDAQEQEGYRVLGEIFVCPLAAIDYCAVHGGDPYEETTLYVIHGLLHLMGYDDLDRGPRQQMRRAERQHFKHLQKINLMLASCK